MKKTNSSFILLFVCLILSAITFGQRVYSPENIKKNTKQYVKHLITSRGNEAFCVIIGGLGPKGAAKFYMQSPTSFQIKQSAPSGTTFLGGDFGPDGTWYATEYSGGFYSIDTLNGNFSLLSNTGETLSGFTYSPAYETYYTCTGDKLYKFDIENYTIEFIGNMGNAGSMTGLGADVRGNLYGIDKNDDNLYKIDPNTGASTAIGYMGYDFSYIQNCTYDKNSDIMYHGGFMISPNPKGALYSIDLETGVATEVVNFPDKQEIASFAVPWTMPEHGSIYGTVSDAISSDPLENVEIFLEPDNFPLGTNVVKTTGVDGLYSFGVVLPGTYKIIAQSSNYGTVIIDDIIVNAGDNLNYNIELQIAPYSATFHVYTFEGSYPVEGANVNFVNQNVQTNSQGTAVFENITAGTHNYSVTKEGYYEGFGELIVIDEDIEVDVYLYEENNIQKNFVLVEEATGTWCVACPTAAIYLEQIIEEGYPIEVIAYHKSDAYENQYSSSRCGYYGVVAYPTCIFNGTETVIGADYDEYLSNVENMMNNMTPVSITFENISVNSVENTILGSVNVENFGPIDSENLLLHIVLIESHIPEIWGGLEELNFVERAMFPDENGTPLDLSLPANIDIDFEISLNDILNLEHTHLIAFVQDNFNKEVYQSSKSEINSNQNITINLAEGYQFISSNIDMEEKYMTLVMADVLNDNLDYVRNSLGQTLRKIGPNWVNGIGDWIVEEGYLVKMFADDSFSIDGLFIDPSTPIIVEAGFQFVSYFPETTMDALIAFETILNDDLDFIRNSQGQTIRKIGPNWVNGIGDCKPGEGYLIKMFSEGEVV
ncbi:MAG: carboxypeptidase regulatory-like domain-containing protein, partial [Bacteroidales bacterium]|nr:carboxypeptidase regulatory-like domain-containing protein [Bacteroidales bacterium]